MPDDNTENMVPISRLNAKQAKIEALEAKLANATATAGHSTAAVQAQLEEALAQVKSLKGEHKALIVAHAAEIGDLKRAGAEQLAMTSAGITDPDIADIARVRYARLDEKDRPDFAEWIAGDAKKDKVLAVLTAERAEASTADATDTAEDKTGTTLPKSTNTGAGATPAAGRSLDRSTFHTRLDQHLAKGEIAEAKALQAEYAGN